MRQEHAQESDDSSPEHSEGIRADSVVGALMLTPIRSWLASHNYHHGHVGQILH